ncbi:FAD-dependent tricarballylate dehydrogenase TcuA [Allonocardiopsis opalescens]|uniref:Tricarballylate dehydrogenase n=1 Tax=Allonocardiopsis opalescens TaxID=1144618 RepID=A0A2T0Q0D4_9ACTN|nr:FAD-dependent tricarballylate dehydrogenase TcuA [Allonocardiopsis opalescens]PRX97257.1 tricarballylate dehydrogenase [Allonocardiopsis opalescens]
MPDASPLTGPAAAPVPDRADVVVVGGGNAGFSAAQAAAGRGRRVLLIEKGAPEEAGGNSFYTAGAFRIAHGGLADLAGLIEADERDASAELPPYPAGSFTADMERVTEGRCDPALTAALVADGQDALRWLRGLGLRFRLMYERQSYPDETGRHVFWGNLAVGSVGGGQGLIEQHTAAAAAAGIEVRYGTAATGLVTAGGRVTGVRWRDRSGAEGTVRAESVVLAAGGFEADAELRRTHLGPGWERAKVRGTPLNTGDMLTAALEIGAAKGGDWSSCHSVAWDAEAGDEGGNRELTNRLTRQSYPLGIVVNTEGRRFVDEGADYRNYTYAKYGAAILRQPGGRAFQLFDAATRPLLRTEEYDSPGATVLTAGSVPELAEAMGVDPAALAATVSGFNAAVRREVPFDPAVKDGRAAAVDPPKSNWAMPLERPPYYAFPVTCGITFTFGGLRADDRGRVLDAGGAAIPGLFVCGEMLGGLFSGNYPGGTGLTSGTVFGRRAGSLA